MSCFKHAHFKSSFLNEKYGTKAEFTEGVEGSSKKKPSVGGVWIFSRTTQATVMAN